MVAQQLGLRLGFFALVVGELLHLVEIARDRVGEIAGLLQRQIAVGHAQHHPPDGLGQQRIVDEARIDEAAVMLEGVVARVIDAAAVALLAESDVQRGHAQMLEEG